MSKESNEIADLRCFAISLSDELEIATEEVIRLVSRLDAYQMVLEGLCAAHQDQKTVLREVKTRIERVARIPTTEPARRERYLGQLMAHLAPLLVALDRPNGPQSG
ncbi:hypothetical protein POK33_12040 [Burkholderia cenocepacia]|uniref:hypothetical protein n=1 Tax=Burkholderia cenocepacia TaxID=95486 RepID=UPI0023B94394|nr:hypothetical protein [Burkholderia cenocepacia]MDF0501447.1 hypothetical protein [Burkholderia cenocepacia]